MVTLVRRMRPVAALFVLLMLGGCSAGTPGDSGPVTPDVPATSGMPDEPSTSAMPDEPSSPATPDDTASASPSDGAPVLSIADSPLGEILVDGDGMTLYLFTEDTQGADISVCEGQCLENWPPVLGVPTAGEGVDDSKLGSFTRSDGSVQASYNGWPLYYWVRDMAPGETTGQNVQGVWFVLDRDGDAVRE